MSAPKPVCQTLTTWLRANLGKGALAPLTSTDSLALDAAVHLKAGVLQAFAFAVRCMQPKCYRFAYHAIAHVMDWHNRPQIWAKAGLPDIEHPGRCEHEPRGGVA